MDVLPASSKVNVYGMSDYDYPSTESLGVSIFPRAYAQSFPQELEDQFKHMQSNFSTGIFPLISRAWMAIDSDLFLWNFETNSDLAFYEEISNTILLVDLVEPKEGFNRSDISFFLVIATTVDILLLPLSFRDEFGNSFSPEETNFKNAYAFLLGGALFKLPLEGLIVTNICCSKNGRIFFAADDSLYELEYYEKSWFSGNTCKKINHSKSLLNSLVPVLYIFSSRDDIRQLELDDSRHILYVLFNKGNIQIFDLGNDGQSIQKIATFLREQIEHDSTAMCNVTADYFKEIVSINAIPLTSDFNTNFVLTTSKGVRIYITCLDKNQVVEPFLQLTQNDIRPKSIRILQIRFPPMEQSFSFHSVNIYSSFVTRDTSMMASHSNENTSFWIFTSSNFVCSNRFDEHNVSFLINGSVWKIVKEKRDLSFGIKNSIDSMVLPNVDPPLINVQHLYSSEKFFVLTSKGVYTYLHLAPVEIFRQILLKYGTESKQFQTFAAAMPSFEICVMAIIVLCSNCSIDNSIRDVALRTFFVHGGEPQIRIAANNNGLRADDLEFRPKTALNGFNHGMNSPCTPFQSPRLSNISIAPLQTSTPHETQTPNNNLFISTPYSPAYNEQSIVAGSPTIVFSPKHDALYAYFKRILSPLSNRQVCFIENEKFISTFEIEHVNLVTEFLFTFKNVIDECSLISSHSYISSTATHRQHIADTRDSASKDQERLSLSNLRNEIILTLEVLKLWIILLEHNFNVLISTLPINLQKNLLSWNFQDLVKNKENICTEIITLIVRFYIGDDASTKIISNRLRESCPTIYTNDDALVVKATENLYRIKSTVNSKEKKILIDEAISTFLQSIQKLNLVQTCDLLIQIGHFQSIVDLALAKADKEDQSKLALIAYKKHVNGLSETVDVSEAIRKRNNAYNCITDTLELLNLVAQSKTSVSSVTLNASTFLFPSADHIKNLSPAIAKTELDDMLRRVFDSDDELANVAVFRWMLTKNMTSFLLESRCRFFETFLFHEIEEGKGNKYLELLWKHYEKNQNHLAAAKILYDMASKSGSRLKLNQRITYLSHALVCIQSEPETKSNLELKIEIQDQLDVAQLQLRTKNLLEFQQKTSHFPCDQKKISDAINILDTELLDLTILYEKYAITYDLFEIKLDVLQCAGHYEQNVVEEIWKSILDRELFNFANHTETESTARGRIGAVICKLKKHFFRSPKFVPIDFILRSLLLFGFKFSVSAEWLPDICNVSEISYANLLDIVSHEYRKNDPFWQKNPKASQYIIDLVIVVCEKFKLELDKFSHNERRVLRNSCLDFLSNLLLDLHFKDSSTQQTKKLEILHAEIERIIP